MISEYKAPSLLFNSHLETIFPSLFRKVTLTTKRERIATPDDDFLDLDWLNQGSNRLVIISHGLEGNSSRPYMAGMARAFFSAGYDTLSWNYRGCSEEMNRQLRFYHSGATDDLDTIVKHAWSLKTYAEINLVGFSLGGNITLKYLGEKHSSVDEVRRAAVFSVPLNLHTSCIQISKKENWIYSQRFLRSLKKKIVAKASRFPELDPKGMKTIVDLITFDDAYTAPLHGFKNAIDYYTKCSSIHFLKNIPKPTLIVNAKNDPFLGSDCFPSANKIDNTQITLETPARGGHCGFALFNGNGLYWSEQRALSFIQQE